MAVVSNYVGSAGSASISSNNTVSLVNSSFGSGSSTRSLSGIPYNAAIKDKEGIFSGIREDGVSGFFTSRNYIRTLDLISEGPIEGLVSGDWAFVGNRYQTGYTSANFISWGAQPENWLKSVYYNDIPIVGEQGYYNFSQVKVSFADGVSKGIRADDNFLNADNTTETQKTRVINERLIGPDIKSDGTPRAYYPKRYRFDNASTSKIHIHFKIPSLRYTKYGESWEASELGETIGTSLAFAVRHRPLFQTGPAADWTTDLGFELQGLLSSPYLHKYTINLSTSSLTSGSELVGWEIEITRHTLDSIDSFVQNQSFIDSVTEVFDSKLSYPNSAIVGTFFSAEYFSSIPNRSFDVRLLKVKVPVGYDPIKKTYADSWSGLFQDSKKWSDNPAWVFYDLITNKRYGLGRYIKEVNIDKWTLYKIAQYCDVLVDDGEGGVEPRFACNVYINTKEEAFRVLQDFASIFRGIVYYGLGDIHAVQDREKDPVLQFNNSNAEEGNFSYSSSSKKTRYSIAIVRYNDKNNFYKPAIEYIEDIDAIKKYGIRETEIVAFGCTSKGQAIRLGRWILHTNSIEQETVSFRTGLDALLLRPGDLIQIADKNRGLNLEGGRVSSISNTGIILDRQIQFGNYQYTLSVTTPTYFYDNSHTNLNSSDIDNIRRSQIQKINFTTGNSSFAISNTIIGSGVDGDIYGTVIGFPNGKLDSENYNIVSGGGSLWTLDDNQYDPEYYNVTDIKEASDINYEIHAVKHFTGKYLYIESGILTAPRDPKVPSSASPPPSAVSILGEVVPLSSNSKKIKITIEKPTALGTTNRYAVYLKIGAAWNESSLDEAVGDFQKGTSPLLPRDSLKIADVSSVSNDNKVFSEYVPGYNNKDYYLLTYAINDVGVYSSSYVKSSAIPVSSHYPIRDISIRSLRLIGDSSTNNAAQKGLLAVNPTSKDQVFTWDAFYLEGSVPNISIEYVVTIRKPSPNNTPLNGGGDILKTYIEEGATFEFPFQKNSLTANGPHRHYDIVVEAQDPINGGKSTDGNNNNYDILEVNNLRPSGYWITPRYRNGERPGPCESNTLLCTAQQITSDGKIEILLRDNAFSDLAGGHVYLSASGFDYKDFTGGVTGVPDNYPRTSGASLADIPYRQILTIPFETNASDTLTNPFYITPNLTDGIPINANYNSKFYMAVSFYDSFDKARKSNSILSWNQGQWVGFQRPFTGSNGEITGSNGKFLSEIEYLNGTADSPANAYKPGPAVPAIRYTGYEACPTYPSRYYSAKSANSFHAWVRINVNGMWEGNGVQMVRTMSTEDIIRYYGWPGYYEYSCEMWETYSPSTARYYPNTLGTMCRFTQGALKVNGGIVNTGSFGDTNLWGKSVASFGSGSNSVFALTGKWIGVPLAWTNTTYGTSFHTNDDIIPSYNETGNSLLAPDGEEDLTRPLHGFRRFRVYFDPNNLPHPSSSNGLASYSIVGINSWNGKYDSFQGRAADDIFFAREGNQIFPQFTVGSWMKKGDLFENVPGVWNHHSAGFGQGFGGLIKTHKFFDVHLGRLIDDSYLQEGFFGVVSTNDYSMRTNFAEYDRTEIVGAWELGAMMADDARQYTYSFDKDVAGYHPAGGYGGGNWASLLK